MNNKIWLLLFFGLVTSCAQEPRPENYFDLIRPEFTGDLAYETTAYVEKYWRVAGNTGFNKTVYWIAEHLEKEGYVEESEAKASDRFIYRIEKRKMENPTWEPISAELKLAGSDKPLLSSETNRNMTYLNSASTPKEGLHVQIVSIDEAIGEIDVTGKVVFTEASAGRFYKELIQKGALGIITYNNPAYLQPEKNSTSIQFRSLPPQTDTKFWGIALSYEAKEKLKVALKEGNNKAYVNIQTKIYPSEELTVVANIRGNALPDERLVFSAHIQEPGANDNATGVGAQLEMAILAANMFRQGKIEIDRTLTFLWGDEIISTRRFIQEDKIRAKGIKWGISLDMVGENTALTGGSFLIEKMPDPSAIWTRGNDKHSEWGGEVLSSTDMTPHYLNDFIIANFEKQGAYANWQVNTNPFEGGSDHTPFLDAGIPGLLLWHFTDQFYHTDNDRLDKVSQETLKNVGVAALASGLQLVNSDTDAALNILIQLETAANERLLTEFKLGKKAIAENGSHTLQAKILKTWEDWYTKSFETVMDMQQRSIPELKDKIKAAQERLKKRNQRYIERLNK
ncbi:M28 family peptidase [Maribacter sp. 2210JD10-5]|uniref:M28 family peptidase n=1 Tax=Maribacter sp. 2210JD10-5 TaxID=3386272 RepID=UPI0039BC5C5A